MAAKRGSPPPKRPKLPDLNLGGFAQIDTEQGLSLDDLGSAFAQLMDSGASPFSEEADGSTGARESTAGVPASGIEGGAGTADVDLDDLLASEEADEACPLCPRTIVEALLFVGHGANRPLACEEMAGLMRGVRAEEIPLLVAELNEGYFESGSAYSIVHVGAGYRLELNAEFAPMCDRFQGRIRETRLSQPAVDVLAVVAYNQPIGRARIDELRGRPSLTILNQLVRRQLVAVAPVAGNPKQVEYSTTARFLELFDLENLGELPRGQEGEEWLR